MHPIFVLKNGCERWNNMGEHGTMKPNSVRRMNNINKDLDI
jgi:hypothetical protein